MKKNFLYKVKPVVKKAKTFLGKVASIIHRLYIAFLSLFEKHQQLRVRYNQYDIEGKIIDNLTRVFEVRRMYKCTPKHMIFKVMNGKRIELKTTSPMDYILEDL
jgi:hypothetical protein